MAISDGRQDSRRTRHERHERLERHDSFRNSREYYHMEQPTAPTNGGRAQSRVEQDARDGRNSRHNEQRNYRHHTYHFDDSASLAPQRAHGTARSRSRTQYTWPPRPTCEDVKASLEREKDGQRQWCLFLENERNRQTQSPGSIGQEPLIQDVSQTSPDHVKDIPSAPPSNAGSAYNSAYSSAHSSVAGTSSSDDSRPRARRDQPNYSHALSQETSKKGPLPEPRTPYITPPPSDDEKLPRQQQQKPQDSRQVFEDNAPELGKRASKPYAFAKPTHIPLNDDVRRPLAPGLLSPLATARPVRGLADPVSKSQPASPGAKLYSPLPVKSNEYFSARATRDEDVIDDVDDDAYDHTPQPSHYETAPRRYDEPPRSLRSPNREFPSHLGAKVRRNTDSADSAPPVLPRLQTAQPRRPSPLGGSSALGETYRSTPSSGTQPLEHSGSSTPARNGETNYWNPQAAPAPTPTSYSRNLPTPPRSPRESMSVPRSHDSSRHSSYTGSVNVDSRPLSSVPQSAPVSARPSRTPDLNALIAEAAARRPKASSSRESTLSRQDSMSRTQQVPGNPIPATRNNILPYPEHDTSFMGAWVPSEIDRHYSADAKSSVNNVLPREYRTLLRTESPARPKLTSLTGQSMSSLHVARPPLASYHSTSELSQLEPHANSLKTKPIHHRTVSFSTSADTRSELQALLRKSVPDNCPRQKPVAGHRDWYTLQNAPSLKFCPDCVGDYFERTQFHRSFYPATSVNPKEKIRCALGSNRWVRLAWLLTIHRRLDDLDLLRHIANIGSDRSCPGEEEVIEHWYGLRDHEGTDVVDGFYVCQSDMNKIDKLFPTLRQEFVSRKNSHYRKHVCAMRAEGNRFEGYTNKMIDIHGKAEAEGRKPDTMRLIHHVEDKSRLPECKKDAMLRGNAWHFLRDVPQLTVCEDCFHHVVQPEVQKGTSIALRFNGTPRPLYVGDYSDGCTDFSCQLYSPRMRSVFRRALNDNDMGYLARKAAERRDAEVRLQARFQDIRRQEKRLTDNDRMTDDEKRRLNRDIDRITDEWQNQWE